MQHTWESCAYKVSVGKPRYKWEDNITIAPKKIGWDGID